MDLEDLIPDWQRSLRARNKSPKTIEGYTRAAKRLAGWMKQNNRGVTRDDLRDYFAELVEIRAPATAETNFKNLQQLFGWLVDEEEIDASPMAKLKPPSVPEKPVPVIPDEDLERLLKVCEGKGFVERRDAAIVRTFLDTGMRVGGLLSMAVDGFDLDKQEARIVLKGRKDHTVPFGAKTADALSRYLRSRKRHRHVHLDSLWLGQRGAMTSHGVDRMVGRRAQQAGIGHIYPHQFRHTHAHAWLLNDGGETDLMQIMGWSSRDMLSRYARSTAHERATDAHRRMRLGDRV